MHVLMVQGGSWIGSLLATIVGNLKLSITNVHIRYEDAVR
jgi:vacuolar protein sorting-associated protein 13A/C